MPNTFLTDSVITKECLFSLKNNLAFTRNVTKEYKKDFKKVGDTVDIRKPSRYTVTTGATLNVQDSVDQSVPITVDKHYHVGMNFAQVDRTLSIEKFRERYIDPAMIALANKIDYQFYLDMYKKVYSYVGVPSATALPSTLKGFTQAKAKINLLGGPKGVYPTVVDPLVEASLVEGLKSLFQSSERIKEQYESGYMGLAAGCEFSSSANVAKHTIGNLGGTPVMKTASVAGATTLSIDGCSASITDYLLAGDVIEIAGVYAVNPQTRQSTGQLAQFVVQADVDTDASGEATITIDRAIYASGQYQNVNALPAEDAAITIFGHASSYADIVCPQNFVFHKSAFAMVAVDLELPMDGVKAERAYDEDAGLSLTMTSQFDITNYRNITRIDFLGGWECIYADLACRVVGQPA